MLAVAVVAGGGGGDDRGATAGRLGGGSGGRRSTGSPSQSRRAYENSGNSSVDTVVEGLTSAVVLTGDPVQVFLGGESLHNINIQSNST